MERTEKHAFSLPPIGQRIIRTSVAVVLCLFYYMLRGYEGSGMPAEAAITAIICVQPYARAVRENALIRLGGTLVGAVWGFLFLLLLSRFPRPGENRILLYSMMGAGILISLYTPVLLNKPDLSGLSAIVFICVVIAYPEIENPLDQAFHRLADVMVGTMAATLVNIAHLPARKRKHMVLFARMEDLFPNRLGEVSPAVMYGLNNLYQEGAKICLVSQHAPALILPQLHHVKMAMPMIVMDGAAIYDPKENRYLATENLPAASSKWLMKRLNDMGLRFFVYTIHRDANFIFHPGAMTPEEEKVYRQFRRSPYRRYMEDDHFSLTDVVYFKCITDQATAEKALKALTPALAEKKLRAVIRPQPGSDCMSLYIYSAYATVDHTRDHLMQLQRQKDPDCDFEEISLPAKDGEPVNPARVLRRLNRAYFRGPRNRAKPEASRG